MQLLFVLAVLTQAIDMYQIFEFAGHGVLINSLVLLLLYMLLVTRLLFTNDKLVLPTSGYSKFFFLLIAAVFLSGLYPFLGGNTQVISQHFKTSLHFYFIVFFAFICLSYPIKNSTWKKAIQLWLVLSVFINIFGIYQIVARAFNLPFAWLDYNNISLMMRNSIQADTYQQLSLQFQNFYRATSFFSEPSALATFNVFTILFYTIPFVQNRKQFISSKLLLVLIVIFSTVGLFLTFSLTGLMCVAAIIITIILIEKKKIFKNLVFVILISFILVIITDSIVEKYSGASVVELFSNRITSIIGSGGKGNRYIVGESYSTRTEYVSEGILLWQKFPITGIGIGTHQFQPEAKYVFGGYTSTVALTETGILGFFFLSAMLFFVFKDSLKIKKSIEYENNSDEVALEGMTVYIIIVLFFINYFSANQFVGSQFWVILGMVFAIHKNYFSRKKHIKTYK